MATAALHSAQGTSLLRILATPFSAFGRFLVFAAENSTRMQTIERLNAMTDEQLAAKGLTRETIVRHVFADRMGL